MAFPSHIADIHPFVELHVSSWASVYKAYQPSLDRVVLLKVLNPIFSREEENANWFKNEARLTAKVKHPNVVSVYGFGESKDGLYFTTEFVEGITLRDAIQRGAIPYPIAIYMLEQMLMGLQAAHTQGVLHRDLKPENVLISLDGHVKLCDFGFASKISAIDENKDIRGTLGYIAPEILLGEQASEGADLFSVGAILYEMLFGHSAFYAKNTSDYLKVIQQHNPSPLIDEAMGIPESGKVLCKALLIKDPRLRVSSVADGLERIHAFWQSGFQQVNSSTVGAWWADPDSYAIPGLGQEAAVARERETIDRPAQKQSSQKWVWRSGIALALLVIAISFVNGAAKQANKSIQQEETRVPPLVESSPVETDVPDEASRPNIEDSAKSIRAFPTVATIATSVADEQQSIQNKIQIHDEEESIGQEDSDSLYVNKNQPAEGHLTVLCLPGCDVQVNGQNKGYANPPLSISLPSGKYKMLFTNEDFPAYEEEVEIMEGQRDTLTVSLLAKMGTLDLTVNPWGEVFIDSTSYGVFPPSTPLLIWPGEHTLRVVHAELGERTITFTIGENEQLRRTINFNEK